MHIVLTPHPSASCCPSPDAIASMQPVEKMQNVAAELLSSTEKGSNQYQPHDQFESPAHLD